MCEGTATVDAITYTGSFKETEWVAGSSGALLPQLHNERVKAITTSEGDGHALVLDCRSPVGSSLAEIAKKPTELYLTVFDDRPKGKGLRREREGVAKALATAQATFAGHIHLVCAPELVPDGIEARPTRFTSVFDVAFDPHEHSPKNRMEAALGTALRASHRLGERELCVAKLRFDQIYVECAGTRMQLDEYCRVNCSEVWHHPQANEFDLVIYERITKRLVAAIELDGSVHRYVYHTTEVERRRHAERWRSFALPKNDDERRRDLDALVERNAYDLRKDWLVSDVLGGTCCRLTAARECAASPRVGSLQQRLYGGQPWLGAREIPWTLEPCEVPTGSPFVYLRIPTDGTTCCEVDALAPSSGGNWDRPTIEDYVMRQLDCSDSLGMRLYV